MSPRDLFEGWLRDLSLAVAFLTRLPLRPSEPPEAVDLARSTRAYPLVGAGIACVGALAFWLAEALGLTPPLAALLALGATILTSGALHEDGLADVADGFGGGRDRARKLAIMRDSRTGSFGVLALILSVALRAAALAALAAPSLGLGALVAAHALSRAMLPLVMRWLRPARADGLAAGFGRPALRDAGAAVAIAALLSWIALGAAQAAILLCTALVVASLPALLARRQVGGYTGDVLGSVQQAVEVALLITTLVLA